MVKKEFAKIKNVFWKRKFVWVVGKGVEGLGAYGGQIVKMLKLSIK